MARRVAAEVSGAYELLRKGLLADGLVVNDGKGAALADSAERSREVQRRCAALRGRGRQSAKNLG
eukprot:2251844-Pyramimonas_sp.AAC.1